MEYVQMNALNFDFLGEKYSNYFAESIANATIHPVTLIEYNCEQADTISYVPNLALKGNSTIINAKNLEPKGAKNYKKKKEEHKQ